MTSGLVGTVFPGAVLPATSDLQNMDYPVIMRRSSWGREFSSLTGKCIEPVDFSSGNMT